MMDALIKMYTQFPGYTILMLLFVVVTVVVCTWLLIVLARAGDLGPTDEPHPEVKPSLFSSSCSSHIFRGMNSSPSSSFTVTDTELRSNLEDYLDRVVEDSDKVIVNRGNGSSVVIMSLGEYNAIRETAYALSQPDLVEAIRQGEEDIRRGNYEIVNVDDL